MPEPSLPLIGRRRHPIADLQIEHSLVSRGPEQTIFPLLRELGIGVTAYGVLSRGLLTRSKAAGPADFRAHLPRFAGENREKNERLVAALEELARARGVTPAQLAIAWARAKQPRSVPLIGARTRRQLADALGALAVELGPDEIAAIERAVPASEIAGARYGEAQMRHLDSER